MDGIVASFDVGISPSTDTASPCVPGAFVVADRTRADALLEDTAILIAR